jgi:site-specific DNA recombinase
MPPPPPPRIAIYARYSSDIQNPSSVDDQVALCRDLAADHFGADPAKIAVYSDAAISGATMERTGLSELLEDAKRKKLGLVVAEGLDRISRSMRDIAAIYDILRYHGIGIWTAHEGHVSELHIGLKGTMNALYLKDLKEKTIRGQAARIAAGFAISACPYGYRIVRDRYDEKGRPIHGLREIVPEEAAVVRRIFEEYAAGRSNKDIARALNAEGIPGPSGAEWTPKTLRGKGAAYQEGLIRNEVYLGRLVYNKSKTMRDPVTGRKREVGQPPETWTRVEKPEWRIVSDDLWNAVRQREAEAKAPKPRIKKPRVLTTHNVHALTGWVFCGACGAPKSIANDSRYTCTGNRYRNTCRNSRGTKEAVLMSAVFDALLVRVQASPDFRPEFTRIFALQMDRSEELHAEEAELLTRIGRYLRAIEDGIDEELAITRVRELQKRLAEIREELQRVILPDLPSEAEIRLQLGRSITRIRYEGTIEAQRIMFGHVLKAVILTQVPERSRGETVAVELREEGWPEFWRTHAAP